MTRVVAAVALLVGSVAGVSTDAAAQPRAPQGTSVSVRSTMAVGITVAPQVRAAWSEVRDRETLSVVGGNQAGATTRVLASAAVDRSDVAGGRSFCLAHDYELRAYTAPGRSPGTYRVQSVVRFADGSQQTVWNRAVSYGGTNAVEEAATGVSYVHEETFSMTFDRPLTKRDRITWTVRTRLSEKVTDLVESFTLMTGKKCAAAAARSGRIGVGRG